MSERFTTEIPVRYSDIDTYGHVNNATYATYLEQARQAYFEDVLGVSLVETGTVLASLEIEYTRPIGSDADVVIELRIPELGTSSLPIDYEIRADGERAATAHTVQVLVDEETGESRPIPDEWRERIDAQRRR